MNNTRCQKRKGMILSRGILILGLLLLNTAEGRTQIRMDYANSYYFEIPAGEAFITDRGDTLEIGGISGIEPAPEHGFFYLLPDKTRPLAGLFLAEMTITLDTSAFQVVDFLPMDAPEFEGEAVRMHPNSQQLYFTHEGTGTSDVLYLDSAATLHPLSPWFASYAALMQWNSGYEGLCFSPDGYFLYSAIERPMRFEEAIPDALAVAKICPVVKFSLRKNENPPVIFGYPLQRQENDNGVSALLTLNDSTLIVAERAWLRTEKKNIVRLFTVNLNNTVCIDDLPFDFYGITEVFRPKLLLNATHEIPLREQSVSTGNVEGITFSHDKSFLLLVTDNNYGNQTATPTQLYVLKIDENP